MDDMHDRFATVQLFSSLNRLLARPSSCSEPPSSPEVITTASTLARNIKRKEKKTESEREKMQSFSVALVFVLLFAVSIAQGLIFVGITVRIGCMHACTRVNDT